jgi:hypothetical protein
MDLPDTMPKPDYIAPALIRTRNFSGLLIHFGMFLYPLLRGKKPKVSYNHSEVRFGPYTSGAISKGVKTRLWSEYVASFKGKYFKNYDYPIELSQEQWDAGYQYLKEAEGTKYEYANFLYHAIKIFTGKWAGSKTTRQSYCLEHLIRFLNATGKYDLDVFMNPYQFEVWADEVLL